MHRLLLSTVGLRAGALGGCVDENRRETAKPIRERTDGSVFHHLGESAAGVCPVSSFALGVLSDMGFHCSRPISEGKAPGAAFCIEYGGAVYHGRMFRVFRRVPLWTGVSVEHWTLKRRRTNSNHHALFRFVRQCDSGRGA